VETSANEDAHELGTGEHDVLIESAVADLESDSATDFPPPASESDDALSEATAAAVEPTDTALSEADGEPEPAPMEAAADTAVVMPVEADEQMHGWGSASSASLEETETEPAWFNDLDEALVVPETQWADTPSASGAVIGQHDAAQDLGEGETTPEETGEDEPLQSGAWSIAEEPSDALMAEVPPQAVAEAEPSISVSPVARADNLLTELQSLLPVIAGHPATMAEAFRSAGVDPDELLERIDELNGRTDTAAIQRVASVADHAEGHEQDVRELEALMAERGVIAELAQTVLEQQRILDELAAVLRSASER
jgi:hypothetical protein